MHGDRFAPALLVRKADEGAADRARRLQAEAQEAVALHIKELAGSLERTVRLAVEVADGGDLYPAGVRDLCRRLAAETDHRALTLEALMARAP